MYFDNLVLHKIKFCICDSHVRPPPSEQGDTRREPLIICNLIPLSKQKNKFDLDTGFSPCSLIYKSFLLIKTSLFT